MYTYVSMEREKYIHTHTKKIDTYTHQKNAYEHVYEEDIRILTITFQC